MSVETRRLPDPDQRLVAALHMSEHGHLIVKGNRVVELWYRRRKLHRVPGKLSRMKFGHTRGLEVHGAHGFRDSRCIRMHIVGTESYETGIFRFVYGRLHAVGRLRWWCLDN